MSCIFGENRDIFFPKLSEDLHLISFAEISVKYLKEKGFEPYICKTEEEARQFFGKEKKKGLTLSEAKVWPCFFPSSDTTGEKDFEEFFTENELLDMNRFENLGIVKNEPKYNDELLNKFTKEIERMKSQLSWSKKEIVDLFFELIPNFEYEDKGKYLDGKM